MLRLIDRLRAEELWFGASWLPRLPARGFVFGARPVGEEVVVSGIGGKVEANESFLAAAQREYEEETGTPPPRLYAAPAPLSLGQPVRRGEDTEGAVALIRKRPDGWGDTVPDLCIAVFFGDVSSEPRPVEKLPAFVVVTPDQLRALARAEPVRADVVGELPDRWSTRVRLQDTPAALAARPELVDALWARPPIVANRPDGARAEQAASTERRS